MDIERRALYTSLRLNWLQDPTIEVEDWQVEDYREMPYSVLFNRLWAFGYPLDRLSFLRVAKDYDSPEELTDHFVKDLERSPKADQVYLILFELWRRLMGDKPSLSIFCYELDFQISIYDQGDIDNSEALQDALSNLQVILEENCDQGMDPKEIFLHISSACAHSIEDFLIDYISEQFDEDNDEYGHELFDGFEVYLPRSHWLELLQARLMMLSNPKMAMNLFKALLDRSDRDFSLDLEIFCLLCCDSDLHYVNLAFQRCLKGLHTERDLRELLTSCLDYQQHLENNQKAHALQRILQERRHKQLEDQIRSSDAVIAEIKKIMS